MREELGENIARVVQQARLDAAVGVAPGPRQLMRHESVQSPYQCNILALLKDCCLGVKYHRYG
jgi:hypothetical protein